MSNPTNHLPRIDKIYTIVNFTNYPIYDHHYYGVTKNCFDSKEKAEAYRLQLLTEIEKLKTK